MDPNQSHNTQPSSQPEIPFLKKPQFFSLRQCIIIAITITVAVIILLILSRSIPKSQPPTSTSQPTSYSGLNIAQKTATFLVKSQTEDGRFFLKYQCYLDKKACYPMPMDGPSGQIMVSLVNLTKVTGDPTYKLIADKAIEAYLNACQTDTKACSRNHSALKLYFKETGDSRFKEALLKIAPEMLSQRTLFDRLANSDVNKLVSLYEVTNDRKYLDLIVQITNQLMAGEANSDPQNTTIYTDNNFSVRIHDLMALDFTFLPAYQVTKNPKYLDYVKNYLEKARLDKNIDKFKQTDNIPELIDGLDSMLQIGQTTEAETIGQVLITDLWDNPQNKKYNGDFGFLQYTNKPTNVKATTNNAWFITIFLQMPDQVFKI